jgi:glycosyltransferase involved in cell wall biosynthesis
VDGTLQQDTSYQERLGQRARDLGIHDRVIFTGFRQDVPAVFRAATVDVQPSRTEGLSNSVLEAMASGAAVVATPVGGTPEVIRHDVTGWIVPVENPPALADAICRLIADPERRQRLGRAARAHVHATLSVARLVDSTVDLYQDLLARRRLAGQPGAPRLDRGRPSRQQARRGAGTWAPRP